MHSSLWLLTKLRLYASWRRFYRSLKTVRGAMLGLFGVAFLAITLLPMLMGSGRSQVPMSGMIENYGPFFLLVYTLFLLMSSVGEQAIYFSPSEVDFLFAAPFTRRQLLVYKLSTSVLSTMAMSLFLAIVNRMQYHNPIAGLLGFFLTFAFLQLLSMFTSLLGQVVSTRAYTRGRRLFGAAVIAAFAFAAAQAVTQWDGASVWDIPELVESTTVGRTLLAPFRVFTDAISAESVLLFLKPAMIGTMMIAGLVAGIFILDADFSDAAIRVSQQRLQRARKIQQGDFSWARKSTNKSSTAIRMLPYWRGCGPLVWRQLVRLLRQSKLAFRIGLVILLAASIPLYRKLGSMEFSPHTPLFALGWLSYFTILFAGSLPLGFRMDIDRMEVLKSLPISPTGIVTGQVGGPVLLMTLLHWFCIIFGCILIPVGWEYWIIGAVMAPLFNCLLIGLSQGLFLLFPVRVVDGAQDPQAAVKNMLITLLQFLAYAVVLLVTAVPSIIVYLLTKNQAATVIVGAVLLLGADLAALVFVRFCFLRFDVTKHAPT